MKKYTVKIKSAARKKLIKMNSLLRVRISELIDSLEDFDMIAERLDIKKLK